MFAEFPIPSHFIKFYTGFPNGSVTCQGQENLLTVTAVTAQQVCLLNELTRPPILVNSFFSTIMASGTHDSPLFSDFCRLLESISARKGTDLKKQRLEKYVQEWRAKYGDFFDAMRLLLPHVCIGLQFEALD